MKSAIGTDETWWLESWGYVPGTPDAKAAWKAKLALDSGFATINAPAVFGDIQPYKSMIDGRMIMSRSQHRVHLKDNDCIEIGNEKMKPKPPEQPKGLRDEIGRAVYQHLGG